MVLDCDIFCCLVRFAFYKRYSFTVELHLLFKIYCHSNNHVCNSLWIVDLLAGNNKLSLFGGVSLQ